MVGNVCDQLVFSSLQNILSTRQAFSVLSSSSSNYSTVSANAPPFYPAADTVESVVESALDDFNLDDFDVSELEKVQTHQNHPS